MFFVPLCLRGGPLLGSGISVTTDDDLLKKSKRLIMAVAIENPVNWIMENIK